MKVFVSYSFVDSELHLLTLLFEKLRRDGHVVDSSDSWYNDNSDYRIYNSQVFIGIITNESNSINQVLSEWEIARSNNIKSILLVEEGVKINDANFKFIRFNRWNPDEAIKQLFGSNKKSSKETDPSDILAGVGIVAGIAALIALFAGRK